jgi:hypothetical protein
LGIIIEVRLEQPAKAPQPIDVMLSGIVKDNRLLQRRKAAVPITDKPSSVVTVCSALHPSNAHPPIVVILLGMETHLTLVQPLNILKIDNQHLAP